MIEQRSEEWFAQRKGRITASAIGAIMGYAPYSTRDDVMDRMIREYQGLDTEFKGNAATDWGTFNEAGAITEFEMETGLKVEPAPFVKFEDWLGASPDGFVSDGRLIEIKCPYGLRNGGEFKSIMEQMHYYAQIQLQLLCTNYYECYFYQWTQHATKLEIVKRDESFISNMLIEAKKFYNEYLEKKETPFKKGYESILMDEYLKLKEDKAKIEERQKELLDGMIKLTDFKGGEINGHKLYKIEKSGSIAYAKVVKDLLPNADLSKYKGAHTTYWGIK